MTARVRQNPTTATEKSGGQLCPRHGQHPTPYAAYQAQQAAVGSPGVDVGQARALLEQAARMRRACPECGGLAPTTLDWAIGIRAGRTELRHLPKFRLGPIEEIDPEAAAW